MRLISEINAALEELKNEETIKVLYYGGLE